MMMHVYSIYDKGVGAYLAPFFCRARGEALRSFQDACNDSKVPFGKYPQDYSLMFLGMYDDQSGMFTQTPSGPELIVSALECVQVATVS